MERGQKVVKALMQARLTSNLAALKINNIDFKSKNKEDQQPKRVVKVEVQPQMREDKEQVAMKYAPKLKFIEKNKQRCQKNYQFTPRKLIRRAETPNNFQEQK